MKNTLKLSITDLNGEVITENLAIAPDVFELKRERAFILQNSWQKVGDIIINKLLKNYDENYKTTN